MALSFKKKEESIKRKAKVSQSLVNNHDRGTGRFRSRRGRQRRRKDSMTQEERAEKRKGWGLERLG